MKRILIFALLFLCVGTAFAQRKKIAVYITGDDTINDIVSSRLVDGLARNNAYTVVERTTSFLNALSKEHKYERDGAVDDKEIAELGKQFSVQYVCVASVLNVWQSEKYITAHIVDVETAEVVATGNSNGSVATSVDLISALNDLSQSLLKTFEYSKNYRTKKVAIYVTRTGNRDVDAILGDQLVAGFARSGKYVAIERTNRFLQELSKEQGYQYSGAVSDEDLTRLGKQFGVQYVCVAKTTQYAGDYFISCRLIDVATAEVVNSYNAEGKKLNNSRSVVDVSREIAKNMTRGTSIYTDVAAGINELRKVLDDGLKGENKGFKYLGDIDTGLAIAYYPDDDILYCGFFFNGLPDGTGMMVSLGGNDLKNCPDGHVYFGQFKNGLKQGEECMVYKMMEGPNYYFGEFRYFGKFFNDKPVDIYPSTSEVADKFRNGEVVYRSFIIFKMADGNKLYIGQALGNNIDGLGFLLQYDGFDGKNGWYGVWNKSKQDGFGIMIWLDSREYREGKWVDGKEVNETGIWRVYR